MFSESECMSKSTFIGEPRREVRARDMFDTLPLIRKSLCPTFIFTPWIFTLSVLKLTSKCSMRLRTGK